VKDYQGAVRAYHEALSLLLPDDGEDDLPNPLDERMQLLIHRTACNAAMAGMHCQDAANVGGLLGMGCWVPINTM
jgi:hypothetical protein